MANVIRDVGSGVTSQLRRRWIEDYGRGLYTAVAESWLAARPQLSLPELAADQRALEAVGWSLALTKNWDGYAFFRADFQTFASDPALAAQLAVLEHWRLAIHEGRYDASLAGVRRLQSALMENASPRLLAHALKVEGVALFRIGRYLEAEALTRRAAELFRLSGDALNLSHCNTNLGLILNARGEIRAGRDELQLAVLSLVEAGAAEERLALARENLAVTEVHLGHEAEARALYEATLAVFERCGLRSEQVSALNGLGHCARLRGHFVEARRYFAAALERTSADMSRQIGLCHEFLGQIDFDCGRLEAAESHARQAFAQAADIAPDGDLMVEASWRLAEVLAVQGRGAEAREHWARAEALCQRHHDRRERGCVERVRARILLAEGEDEQARAAFRAAAEVLESCGRLFEAALTQLALAESEAERPSAALVPLLDSLRDFVRESLPACGWILERVEALRPAATTPPASPSGRHGFVTADPELLALLEDLPAFAASPHPVLLEGESGTGKELVARALHVLSGCHGVFVAVNCAAIPRDLFESELFGHARGAFSGASGEKPGLLEQAAGGTLLLDEIGEMPQELQAKLLRFLDDGVLRRIGEIRERHVRVKIVAATNRPLRRGVTNGDFRADLFHRLAVHPLEIKPLRQRRSDVALLALHFLRHEGLEDRLQLTPALLAELESQPWPGNARELRNELIRRAMQRRVAAALPEPVAVGSSTSLRQSRRGHERALIEAALRAHPSNLTAAARSLEMHVTTLRRKMRALGLSRLA